jgi:PAS domain-containing protein
VGITPRRADAITSLAVAHDGSPDAVICVDRGLVLLYANGAAGRLFGFDPEEAVGSLCDERMGLPDPCRGCRAAEAFDGAPSAAAEGVEMTAHLDVLRG